MPGIASRENGKKGGRPKGKKSASTLEREAVLSAFRQRVMGVADNLMLSQLHLATGQTYLFKIEKKLEVGSRGGKRYVPQRPKQVTALWEIEAYLTDLVENGDMHNDQDPAATYYYMTAIPPQNAAIDSLLDRTFDKAKQRTELTGADGKDLFPDAESKAKSDDAIRFYLTKNGIKSKRVKQEASAS